MLLLRFLSETIRSFDRESIPLMGGDKWQTRGGGDMDAMSCIPFLGFLQCDYAVKSEPVKAGSKRTMERARRRKKARRKAK